MLPEEELARWYFLFRSPARLKILELLYERGPLTFSELRKELGLGVGTIYYHLSIISDLIRRDARRRYALNELGLRVYRAIRDGSLPSAVRGPTAVEKALKAILLSPLFRLAAEKPFYFLPLALSILLLGAFGCARAGLLPLLLFYAKISTANQLELFLHYIGQWAFIFLLCEFLSLIFYRRRGAELELFIGICLASFPVAIFPYLYAVLTWSTALNVLSFLQLWSTLLICSAISLCKGMRIDKALPIGMFLMFLNVFLLISLGFLRL